MLMFSGGDDGQPELCTSDQFACADGLKCIPNSWQCDGDDDCEDCSDESESLCLPPCSTDMFACADGSQCIPKSKHCNGYTAFYDSRHLLSKFAGCSDNSHNFPSGKLLKGIKCFQSKFQIQKCAF